MLNKKGQTIIYWFFGIIVFVIVWVMFLSDHLAEIGLAGVIANNLTGVEAFVLSNMNLIIGFFLLLLVLMVAMWSRSG